MLRTLSIFPAAAHLFLVAAFSAIVLAQPTTVEPPPGIKPVGGTVAARVNDEPLYVEQIEQQLKKTLGGSLPAEHLRARAMAQMLEQTIRQRLVEEFLVRGTPGMGVRDLDALVESLESQTKKKGQSFATYLTELGLTERTLRKRWAWTLGWAKYLETQYTDERLIRTFDAHRLQLDGSQVRASQLLVKAEEPVTPEKLQAAIERAARIRKLIADGKLSFADAVRDYSQAPSADAGGDLGLVTREDLPDRVGAALMKLKAGEISEPVVTPFGVHLVTVTEIKPGNKKWQEAREEIKRLVAAELFAEIAGAERPAAKIEYTGAMPYLGADGTLVEKK